MQLKISPQTFTRKIAENVIIKSDCCWFKTHVSEFLLKNEQNIVHKFLTCNGSNGKVQIQIKGEFKSELKKLNNCYSPKLSFI